MSRYISIFLYIPFVTWRIHYYKYCFVPFSCKGVLEITLYPFTEILLLLFYSFLMWIPLCIQVHVYIWAFKMFPVFRHFKLLVSVCPSFVGVVSVGKIPRSRVAGSRLRAEGAQGVPLACLPRAALHACLTHGKCSLRVALFAVLRLWVSLNTLSVGKNFFYIFPVKCVFISFTHFSFFWGLVPWSNCCLHIRISNPLLQVFLPVCSLPFVIEVFLAVRSLLF